MLSAHLHADSMQNSQGLNASFTTKSLSSGLQYHCCPLPNRLFLLLAAWSHLSQAGRPTIGASYH